MSKDMINKLIKQYTGFVESYNKMVKPRDASGNANSAGKEQR
ncbi:hypothetical protein [Nicoliella lavandulae]|uniref:Uncharacterized protein n=1 Tax=Nicoliella lavandulae TaxID=3082954 RepID=A0ABU8SMA1_9LACO